MCMLEASSFFILVWFYLATLKFMPGCKYRNHTFNKFSLINLLTTCLICHNLLPVGYWTLCGGEVNAILVWSNLKKKKTSWGRGNHFVNVLVNWVTLSMRRMFENLK